MQGRWREPWESGYRSRKLRRGSSRTPYYLRILMMNPDQPLRWRSPIRSTTVRIVERLVRAAFTSPNEEPGDAASDGHFVNWLINTA